MKMNDRNNKNNESSLQKKLKLFRQKYSNSKSLLDEKKQTESPTEEVVQEEQGEQKKEDINDVTPQDFEGNSEKKGTDGGTLEKEVAPKSNEEDLESSTEIAAEVELGNEPNSDILDSLLNAEDTLIGEQEELPPEDAEVIISVSVDKMTAFMVVTPPMHGGKDVSLEMVKEQLATQKVSYGIKQEEIDAIIDGKLYNHEAIIAKGNEPIHGKDGEIVELKLRDTKQKVHTREDGTIDFKNLGAVNAIKEGERIIKIVPPEEGTDGQNVLGKVLRGKNGKKARVDKGENTSLTEDGEYLIATCEGDLKYSKNGFSVSRVFIVKGNLDNTIGNIEFIGDVDIKGDVMEGFSVTAKGNVNIGGMVEGASITAGGNITIRNGINGMGSGQLYAGGEVRCKFIENSTVIAKGDIYAESIINSCVSSHSSLYVAGKRGALIGGKITIQNQIEAKMVGSQSNVPTEITLGAPPEMLEKRCKLHEELSSIKKRLEEINKDIEYLTTVEKNRGLTDSRKKQLAQLKMNKPLEKMRAQRVEKLIDEINQIINNADKCKLSCQTIYPAIKISIRDSVIITKVSDNKCTYMYIDGEVKKLQN